MSRHWVVRGSVPKTDPRSWRENVECRVVAETAERALACVRAKHPEILIWSLEHGGKIDFIEDQEPSSSEPK